ncbi:hypothetical protein [Natronorubrum sp. FCH18a]|uniref:hypothetical protein n=1 Tax=Natronorubrum sp. FCH18a TaxID=3447018 RepID=UPI003F51A630
MSKSAGDSKVSHRSRTDPRLDYIEIGVDADVGASHVYRTVDETVLVIEGGEIAYRYDLEELGKSVNNWIDYVEARRGGFARQHLYKDLEGAIGGTV